MMNRAGRLLAAVLWPAFLVAAILEIGVFAMVDPAAIHTLGGGPLPLSATAVYSIAFLAFWLLVGVACSLTVVLTRDSAVPGFNRGVDGRGA
jgi:hypothetical protein